MKFPIYYGWFLLPFATLGVIMSMPGQTAGFSAFTEPLLGISGIGRTQLSFAYMLGTMGSGFLLPFVGTLLDRIGSRKLMTAASVLLGATLLYMSRVDRIAGVIAGLGVPASTAFFLCFVLGIFGLRFFGQGTLPLSSNTMVGKWFDRSRGRAIAMMGVANSLAFSAAPVVMNRIVATFGWRGAWSLLAGVLALGVGGMAWLVYRDTPESCGLHVENRAPEGVDEGADPARLDAEIHGVTLAEASRTLPFWLLVLLVSFYGLVITGFTFHIEAIGAEAGIPVVRALAVFVPVTFISVPLGFLASWSSASIKPKWYFVAMAAGQTVAYASMFFLSSPVGYVVSILGLGVSGGLMGTMLTAIPPLLFGRKHLGAINGSINSTLVIATAIGPILLSLVQDLFGSLTLGIFVFALFPLMTLVPSLRSRIQTLPSA